MESTKQCPFCAEEILVAAIKCKHCASNLTAPTVQEPSPPANVQPARFKEPSVLRSLLGVLGVAGLMAYGLNHCSSLLSRDSASEVSSASTTNQSVIAVPDGSTQLQFCAFVKGFRQKYEDALRRGANEAELSELRHDRKDSFASIIGEGEATNWTGVLNALTTNSEGEATLTVHLWCPSNARENDPVVAALDELVDKHITLWNWTNIPRGTPLYSTLMKLKEGNPITFSGKLAVKGSHGNDYVSVNNMTERGSMTDPTFEFVYTDAAAIPDSRTSPMRSLPRHEVPKPSAIVPARTPMARAVSQTDAPPMSASEREQYYYKNKDIFETRMSQCLQQLPVPRDGLERDVEKVLRGYLSTCGQEYIAFWRLFAGSEQSALATALVTSYKAVGCTYANKTEEDLQNAPQGGRAIICSPSYRTGN